MNLVAVILVVSLVLLGVALAFAPRLVLVLFAVIILAKVALALLVVFAGVAGFVIWLAMIVVAAMTLMQLRINQQRALLDLLALATDKQMPLTAVVRAFAADQSALSRQRLGRFADDLKAGVPLGDALHRTPSALPRQASMAVRLGERTGMLHAALQSVAGNYTLGLPLRQALIGRVFYLAWMAFMIPAVFVFVAIKIFPAFAKIFDDFEIELPTMTVLLFKFLSNEAVQLLGFFAPLLALALLAYVSLYYIGIVPAPTFGFGLWINRAPVLRALALAVESNCPIAEAIDRLAESYPNRSIARRLHATAASVASGGDWIQALLKYSLIGKSAAAVMQTAQRVGNLPWALRQVAESSERRLHYRLEASVKYRFAARGFCTGWRCSSAFS